jgi:gamma-glutamylcyclotransferase (GGCT)/AIG2-like uncharacterized protein YtfP
MVWCPRDQKFRDCGCTSDHSQYCVKIYGKAEIKEPKVGGKLDILRDALKEGDGVLVETSFRHWEWGAIQQVFNGSHYLVQFWPKHENSYWKQVAKADIYPEDWTFDDVAADFAVGNVVTLPQQNSPATSTTGTAATSLPWLKPEPIEHVFVYGTLKQKERLHWAMKDCTFVGEDYTKSRKYKMFSVGDRFPGVTCWKGTCAIKGEVYKLPVGEAADVVLKQLDKIEGTPDLFRRDDTRTLKTDLKCHIYLASLKLENTYDNEFGQNIYYDDVEKAHIWLS